MGKYEDDTSACALSGSNWSIVSASGETKRSTEQHALARLSPRYLLFGCIFGSDQSDFISTPNVKVMVTGAAD